MSPISSTDSNKQSATDEFIWDTNDHTEVHNFVAEPIISLLKTNNVTSVLDLGCGNGSFTRLLHDRGFNVTGMDSSNSGLRLAKSHSPAIDFIHHDLSQSLGDEIAENFDAVVSVEVIEHLLLPRRLLESAQKALRPGGIFILTTPYHGYWKNLALALTGQFDSHWHPLRNYGHIKFFSKSTITTLFSEFGFSNLTFKTVGRIPALARSMIVSGIKSK